MNNTGRRLLLNALKLLDLCLMIFAFIIGVLAVVHHNHTISIVEFFSMRVKIQNFILFLLFILAWHLIFKLSSLYESRRLSRRLDEVIEIIQATSLGAIVIVVFTSTASTLEFARKVISHPELGYRIAGFVDQDWNGIEAFRKSEFALASDFASFPQFLRNTVVDEVVMALPFRSMHAEATGIATLCEEQGITVRVLTNIFDLKLPRASTEELEGSRLITHCAGLGSVEGWPLIVKRVLDVTISSIAIILLSPVLIVAAVLIKLSSPGPVLFVQRRLGLNKRQFKMYKFRTMVVDAEKRIRDVEHLNEISGPVFKIRNDPRVTPLGAFLRKTSIDELPQLFNTLRGDMSLVGPRPLPVRDYQGFDKDWQRRRFSVKPGMTCLWQVRGRSAISFEKWMELDLQYIDGWSLRLDFQILLLTIPVVLRGSGAA